MGATASEGGEKSRQSNWSPGREEFKNNKGGSIECGYRRATSRGVRHKRKRDERQEGKPRLRPRLYQSSRVGIKRNWGGGRSARPSSSAPARGKAREMQSPTQTEYEREGISQKKREEGPSGRAGRHAGEKRSSSPSKRLIS